MLFLAAVAAALTAADLNAPTVIGLMLLGWVVVALFEWAAWLDEPHFGSGLPPRYYVPQPALPPPRVIDQNGVDQESVGYPVSEQSDEESTWIASPEEWGEVLEDWPMLDSSSPGEETEIAVLDGLEVELPADVRPPAPEAEPTSELDLPVLDEPEPAAAVDQSEAEPELAPLSPEPESPLVSGPAVPTEAARPPPGAPPEPEPEPGPEVLPRFRRASAGRLRRDTGSTRSRCRRKAASAGGAGAPRALSSKSPRAHRALVRFRAAPGGRNRSVVAGLVALPAGRGA